MVVEMGRLVLGGGSTGWNKGGCFVPHTGLPRLQEWSPSPRKQPWVHNLAPHLLSGSRMANFSRAAAHAVRPRQRACKEKSAGLHESLKLVAKINGTVFDLLDKCDADSLLSWLGAALPRGTTPSRTRIARRLGGGRQAQELVAALYADEEDGDAAGGWLPCLQVRLSISDVGFLHELRDAVLMLGPNPNPNPKPNC